MRSRPARAGYASIVAATRPEGAQHDHGVHRPPQREPLPGGPTPYFLSDGEGEKAIVIDSLFTVLLIADETDGQFGVFTMDGPKGDAIPPHSHGTHHEISTSSAVR